MSDVRVYLSFDLEHDRDLHDRLAKQARKPATFAITDRSEGGEMTDEWTERVRSSIAEPTSSSLSAASTRTSHRR
jgi:hypothetical protein